MKKKLIFILRNIGIFNCIFLTILFILLSILEILGIGLIIPLVALMFGEKEFLILENLNFNLPFDINNSENFLIFILSLFLFVYLIKTLLFIFSISIKNKIVFNMQKKFSNKIYNYYINLPYKKFVHINSSDAVKLITQTTSSATTAFILPIILIISEVFIIIFISIMLMIVDFNSTFIIMIIFLSGIFIISRSAKNKNYKWGSISEVYHAMRVKHLIEILKSFKEVIIYGKKNFFNKKFVNESNQTITAIEKHTSWLEFPRSLLEFLIIVCAVIFLFFSIKNTVPADEIITKIGIFVLAGLRLLPSSTRITNSINSIRFGTYSFDTILNLLKNEKKKINNNIIDKKYYLKKSIIFKNVTFFYNKGKTKNGLSNLNFEIKKNQILCIFGKSGSGKTTIINLILGLIDAQKGQILIDDINIKNIKQKFRNNIGYVPQETFLMDQSLKENIAFGENKSEINNINLERSLLNAEIFDIIKRLPKNLNTIAGENGIKISGGEKQRVGIARALYKSPQILIFDEPTSSLDINTEEKILKTIKKLKKTKTIIIVSHSNKIKKIADKIIYLK